MHLAPPVTSDLQWISQMDVDIETPAARKTTIIGTIGKHLFEYTFPPPTHLSHLKAQTQTA